VYYFIENVWFVYIVDVDYQGLVKFFGDKSTKTVLELLNVQIKTKRIKEKSNQSYITLVIIW